MPIAKTLFIPRVSSAPVRITSHPPLGAHPRLTVLYAECRFTCHKRCARDIYIRCLANPQYREWEEMTTELAKGSHPHALQEVSVRAPCFCAHCGHIIPIAGPADENFKCHGTPPELADGAEMLIRGRGVEA